jgi:hypothetical protein
LVIADAPCDESSKGVKEFRTLGGTPDKDVAAVAGIALPPNEADRAELVEGAGDDRLRNAKLLRKPAHGVGAFLAVDEDHERHLPVGQIRLA